MSPLHFNSAHIFGWLDNKSLLRHKDEDDFIICWLADEQNILLYRYTVAIYGSSPFDNFQFQEFLQRNNVDAIDLETEPEWLDTDTMELDDDPELRVPDLIMIVGEYDWVDDQLAEFLDKALAIAEARGGRVRVYSQEMFLFRIMSGVDPFDAPREVLEEFGRGHPALQYLSTLGFDWPSCQNIAPGYGEFDPTEIGPKVGVLKRFGYKVGVDGIHNADRRRQILERVYTLQLPSHLTKGLSAAYLAEWGEPKSTQRLKKLADSLAALARNAQRRDVDMSLAIQHWESDLAWLKAKFYTGAFRFQWPGTDD